MTVENIALKTSRKEASTRFCNPWLSVLKSNRIRRLGREFFWVGLGQAAAVAGAIVGVRVLTGLLNPQLYGELALAMTLATLVNQVIMGPLGNGVTRFFSSAREADAVGDYLGAVRNLLIRVTTYVLGSTLLLSLGLALAGRFESISLGLAAMCFALLSGYNTVLNGMQNAARQRAIVALHQGLASWGRFVLAIGFIILLGVSSTKAMAGYSLAMFFVLGSQWLFFRRTILADQRVHGAGAERPGFWQKEITAYSRPFALFGVFTWAYMASNRWSLELFASTEDVGMYAVLYQLGYYPIAIMTGLMMQLMSPVLFERVGDASDTTRLLQAHRLNRRVMAGALLLTGAISLAALFGHHVVFRCLVSTEYRSISWLLPGIVLAGGLFATGQIASLSLMSEARSTSLLWPKVVTSLVGVGLSIIGAALYQVKGIVGANIIFSASYFFWMYLVVRHRRAMHYAVVRH